MAKKDWMIIESELDEDQIKVLMATLEKSCVVSGCAGSGKSVLALIKAQRIQKEKGDDYQIIVYTKALCRYMNSGREILGLRNTFTYHWDWVNRKGKPSSRYVIVDEIQDFTEEEIKEFINATNSNFYFFGDTAQSIYGGLKETLPVDEIPSLLPRDKRPKCFELYRNYRLPLPIARFVQYVGIGLDGFDEDTYKSKENIKPKVLTVSSTEQIKKITEILSKHPEYSDVAILVPHNTDVDIVFEAMSHAGINCKRKSKAHDNLNFETSNPKIMTYHSAKGLQFETVFMPLLSELPTDEKKESAQKAVYVAMTRTYRNLFLILSTVPSYLTGIPSNLYDTSEIEDVEDI